MQNEIVCILGKKGSGKSTLAKKYIMNSKKPVIIWDFLGEYENDVVCENLSELQKSIEYVLLKKKRLVIAVRKFTTEQFPILCCVAYEIGNFMFVIEEATAVCNPSYIPEEFAFCFRYGRHKGLDLLTIAQRPPEINRLLTSQSDIINVFRFTEPRDIDYIQRIDHTYNPEKLKKYEYHIIDTRD